MKPALIRWVFASFRMLACIYLYDSVRTFAIVREHPQIIPFLLVMYPVLSALLREFIFCSFFFERYKRFFKTPMVMILASALVFAYEHMLFINWVARVLSFIAGVIFAIT